MRFAMTCLCSVRQAFVPCFQFSTEHRPPHTRLKVVGANLRVHAIASLHPPKGFVCTYWSCSAAAAYGTSSCTTLGRTPQAFNCVLGQQLLLLTTFQANPRTINPYPRCSSVCWGCSCCSQLGCCLSPVRHTERNPQTTNPHPRCSCTYWGVSRVFRVPTGAAAPAARRIPS